MTRNQSIKQFDCKISKSRVNLAVKKLSLFQSHHNVSKGVRYNLNSSYGKKMRWMLLGNDTKTDLGNRKTIKTLSCMRNNKQLALNLDLNLFD